MCTFLFVLSTVVIAIIIITAIATALHEEVGEVGHGEGHRLAQFLPRDGVQAEGEHDAVADHVKVRVVGEAAGGLQQVGHLQPPVVGALLQVVIRVGTQLGGHHLAVVALGAVLWAAELVQGFCFVVVVVQQLKGRGK